MPYTVKSFVTIDALVNNARGQVSELGELTPHSRTFTIDKGYFSETAKPGMELIVFSTKLNDNAATIPANLVSAQLAVSWEIYTKYKGADLIKQLTTAFPTYTAWDVGSTVKLGDVYMPRWVKFTVPLTNDTAVVRIWFSDPAFRQDYDEWTIKIVPPANPVTALYGTYQNAQAAVMAMDYMTTMNLIETTRDNEPTTLQKVFQLRWNDPGDLTKQFMTNWTVLGYGPQASRTDNILEAIRTYLTENSRYSVDQWRVYIPDLKTTDTFTLVPLWDRVAISSGPNLESLYNPMIAVRDIGPAVNDVMPWVSSQEATDVAEFMPILWKSLPVAVLASSGNSADKRSFITLYPNYTVLNFNDQNIQRLSASTLQIIRRIETLARLCEEDTGTNALPTDISRNVLNEVMFLEMNEGGVVFRMMTRKAYLSGRS